MVLAAGLGTRLWPLTADRAKPAVLYLGRPLISRLLEYIESHGVTRAVINTHYRPESVIHAAHKASLTTLKIDFSREDTILGTGGALAKARDCALLAPDVPTLVINGKLNTDINLTEAFAAHQQSGCAVTLVLIPNPHREHFREVLVDKDRVIGFGEGRIPKGDRPLLFTGIHILNAEVLAKIPHENCDTIRDIYPPLIDQNQVHAHLATPKYWQEFSTIERYLTLHQWAYQQGQAPDVVCAEGASVAPEAETSACVLWENASIEAGARVRNTVLGAGVVIRSGEELTNAVAIRWDLAGPGNRGTLWGDRLVVPLRPKQLQMPSLTSFSSRETMSHRGNPNGAAKDET